jgi:hypothetical protein
MLGGNLYIDKSALERIYSVQVKLPTMISPANVQGIYAHPVA